MKNQRRAAIVRNAAKLLASWIVAVAARTCGIIIGHRRPSHYFIAGSRHPAFFDAEWYLSQNPDVVSAGLDPFRHLVEHGAREGRSPHPLFCPRWYLEHNQDAQASGMAAWLHYQIHGIDDDRAPCPDFDVVWYVQAYPESEAYSGGPVAHYWNEGAQQGNRPNAHFDPVAYTARFPDAGAPRSNPLVHFLHVTRPRGWTYLDQPPPEFLDHGPSAAAMESAARLIDSFAASESALVPLAALRLFELPIANLGPSTRLDEAWKSFLKSLVVRPNIVVIASNMTRPSDQEVVATIHQVVCASEPAGSILVIETDPDCDAERLTIDPRIAVRNFLHSSAKTTLIDRCHLTAAALNVAQPSVTVFLNCGVASALLSTHAKSLSTYSHLVAYIPRQSVDDGTSVLTRSLPLAAPYLGAVIFDDSLERDTIRIKYGVPASLADRWISLDARDVGSVWDRALFERGDRRRITGL